MARTALTPTETPHNSVTFREAESTFVCRKLYAQDLDPATIPEEIKSEFYGDDAFHRVYIGEVVELLE